MKRRTLLAALPGLAACRSTTFQPSSQQNPQGFHADSRSPEAIASDESLWVQVQEAFAADRSLTNFNNGGVSPSPEVVQSALKELTRAANSAPSYVMWREQESEREGVRESLAGLLHTDPEQVAITRNTSEGLQICQQGIDLRAGDQVLCCDQEYPRMLSTFRQRAAREGIELVRFPIPVPLTDPTVVVDRFRERITPKTRMLLISQVVNLTGQFLPVREVCALGREHGIPVLVDGAHGFAHRPFRVADLGADFYATSLHKWLCAPFGTGLLYVARERINALWPLMAAASPQGDDIRKFEEIGTHSLPLVLSIRAAVDFHRSVGSANIYARLCHLRNQWVQALHGHDRLRWNTDFAPQHVGGIANFGIEGIQSGDLQKYLWQQHRIYTITITHKGVDEDGQDRDESAPPQIDGIRVSPSFYSTPFEVERFVDVMKHVLKNGLTA